MFKFNFKKIKNTAGFTILEALVATSILMVAVAAPITIAQKGLSSTTYSKNQMTAAYLAQDAIEYIKNQRDQVSMRHSLNDSASRAFDWEDLEVFDLCKQAIGCQIDTINDEVVAFNSTPLKKDVDNGTYQYATGDNTIFTRQVKIKMDPFGSNIDEALITVTVSWGGEKNNVTVNTLIYNI